MNKNKKNRRCIQIVLIFMMPFYYVSASQPQSAVTNQPSPAANPETTPPTQAEQAALQGVDLSSLPQGFQNAAANAGGNPIATATDVQSVHLSQGDYFFNQLPQATPPDSIAAQIDSIYGTVLGFPQKLLDHIHHFYGLLYLVAETEQVQKSVVLSSNQSSTSQYGARLSTELVNGVPKLKTPLTGQQLIESQVWQHYLQIETAQSYEKEMNFLAQILQNELLSFDYIPQFELNYYQDTFIQQRALSQLTRIYLLLTDRLRDRYIAQCLQWKNVIKPSDAGSALVADRAALFSAIQTFKQSDFYTITTAIEAVDPQKIFPIGQANNIGMTPVNTYIQNVLSQKNGAATAPEFFTYFKLVNGKITIQPNYQPFFTFDSKGNVVMTGLGALIFTGTVTNNVFEKTTVFSKLFAEAKDGSLTPTLGYMEILVFSALKILNTEIQGLNYYASENLVDTFQKLEKVPSPSPIPFIIFYQPQDYIFLDAINQLQAALNNTKLVNRAAQDAQVSAAGCTHSFCDFFTHTLKDAFEDLGNAIYDKVIKPAVDGIKNAADAVWHGIKAAWDEAVSIVYAAIVLPCAFIGDLAKGFVSGDIFHGKLDLSDADAALHNAQNYQKQVGKEVSATMKDLESAISDVADAAKGAVDIGASIAGSVLSKIDSNLGKDFEGLVESVADLTIDQMKGAADMVVEYTGSTVKLTAEAINIASTAVGDLVTGNAGDLGDSIKQMAEDTASALLSGVTLAVSNLKDQFQDVMKGVGYFIATLTDLVTITASALSAGFKFLWDVAKGDSFSDAAGDAASTYSSVHKEMDKHRRLISGIITTTILIGITVATGGAATPFTAGLLAVNIGMMTMNVVGDAQQDQEAITKQENQEAYVKRYSDFVTGNKTALSFATPQQTSDYMAQLQAEEQNKIRSVGYYENYLNDVTNMAISNQAYGLGLLYNAQTQAPIDPSTKQPVGVMPADPGYLYGVSTGRMVLNPGTGFVVYNPGRGTFGQEVAAIPNCPEIINVPSSSLDALPQVQSNWFKLRDHSNVPAGSPLMADVMWRSVYEENVPFYIGIYLTERSLDTNEMHALNTNLENVLNSGKDFTTQWEQLDTFNRQLLDFDHLAKMFVCYREQAPGGAATTIQTTPKLGIYEHETAQKGATNGWLPTTYKPLSFKRGTWYRMQAKLEGTSLTTAFWEAGKDEEVSAQTTPPADAITQTVSITQATPFKSILNPTAQPAFSGSIGIIASGAVVEYKVLQAPSIQTVAGRTTTVPVYQPEATPARTTSDAALDAQLGGTPTEYAREKAWQDSFTQGVANTATFGNYKLTIADETLPLEGQYLYTTTGTLPNNAVDYVLLVSDAQVAETRQLGVTMSASPNGMVSLISNILYAQNGTVLGMLPNALTEFERSQGGLELKLKTTIRTAQQAYQTSIAQPIVLANITLTLNPETLAEGLFVYTGTLFGGTKDYYMLVSLQGDTVTADNQVLNKTVSGSAVGGMVSLTTNTVYQFQAGGKAVTYASNNASTINAAALQVGDNLYSIYQQQLSKAPATQKAIDGIKSTLAAADVTKAANTALNTALGDSGSIAQTKKILSTYDITIPAQGDSVDTLSTQLQSAETTLAQTQNTENSTNLGKVLASLLVTTQGIVSQLQAAEKAQDTAKMTTLAAQLETASSSLSYGTGVLTSLGKLPAKPATPPASAPGTGGDPLAGNNPFGDQSSSKTFNQGDGPGANPLGEPNPFG